MRVLIALLLLCSCAPKIQNTSGHSHHAKPDKRSKKYYTQAVQANKNGNTTEAIRLLRASIASTPGYLDAHRLIGGLYYKIADYKRTVQHLEQTEKLQSAYDPKVAYTLGLAYFKVGKYHDAQKKLQNYLDANPTSSKSAQTAKEYIRKAQIAIELSKNKTQDIVMHRLGPEINTPAYEYLPSFSLDGQKLIFTRRVHGNEDLYSSQLVNGSWQKATPIEQVNTPHNEGAHTVAADGNLVIFTACNRPDGLGGCDLYYTRNQHGIWTTPKNLGHRINSSAWDAQPSLSADGTHLYFSSNRPGGKGGKDIWVSVKNKEGHFDTPYNLGTPVNTSADELTPFIHADGQTLYFTSDGHPGFGNTDLFFSRYQNQKWTNPVNLGKPINSPMSEGALHLSTDGSTAYFARNQSENTQATDIFYFNLPKSLRPIPTTYLKLQVINADTGKAIENATVTIIDNSTADQILTAPSDKNGMLVSSLPLGKDYAVQIQKKGFIFYSDRFDLSKQKTPDKAFELIAALSPVKELKHTKTENPIVLKNVFFDSASYQLKNASKPELNLLVKLLKESPQLHIKIYGHTDNVGAEQDNLILSTRRADAVKAYLIDQGVEANRITAKGFGETVPVADNQTAEGRAKNRRTEFVITNP